LHIINCLSHVTISSEKKSHQAVICCCYLTQMYCLSVCYSRTPLVINKTVRKCFLLYWKWWNLRNDKHSKKKQKKVSLRVKNEINKHSFVWFLALITM
jgi:hypothetical protein